MVVVSGGLVGCGVVEQEHLDATKQDLWVEDWTSEYVMSN